MTPFERICGLLEQRSGHVLDGGGRARLRSTVVHRMAELGMVSMEAYARLLLEDKDRGEWQVLLSQVTIKESYLFRGPAQWTALENQAVPELAEAARREGGELVAWSAACARGEEAATLAMVLAASPHMAGCSWRIVATDVDRSALEVSRRGVFPERAIRNVPPDLARKYLEPVGAGFRLIPALLDRIEFRWLNLVDTPWPFSSGAFHIVLVRNVLIYFSEENRRRVTREARRVLAPGGWLFVGASESLWGTTEGLQAINLGRCFAYRHGASPAAARHCGSGVIRGVVGAGSPPTTAVDHRTTHPEAAPPGGCCAIDIAGTVHRLAEGDAEGALAMAIRLLETGRERAELQALAGMCHERLDQPLQAVERYRAALYLEPGLFQVHWLLAGTLEREGWSDRSRQEYRTVLELARGASAIPLSFAQALGLPGKEEAARRAAEALGE